VTSLQLALEWLPCISCKGAINWWKR